MNLLKIDNEHEYQTCIQNAQTIETSDKSLFCPNFYYVFYAELEIHLNQFFSQNEREQWSLLFTDYNFMLPISLDTDAPYKVIRCPFERVTILHNAKIKYCCKNCKTEWTTARGRVIFQAEIPQVNHYNILFAYLFTQKCRQCYQEILPCWYLDEATRVMKNVCRILREEFYSHQYLKALHSEEIDDGQQRQSYTREHHQQNLCLACQQNSCYASYLQQQRRR
ncbi:unnamed protein product [Adineta steineri]|uniref:3CxxC-type domain-containing protein n=1 Tax=Adineta steineri TaxID=433720 RepID=A0A813VW53_9BILA|nr:unnamed protein product [Adineta steineri]CAF3644830.1 unnamed protein product [Adineta steineri]